MIQQFLKKESSGLIDIKIPCVKPLPKPRNYIILISLPDMLEMAKKTWQTIDSALHRKPPKSNSELISINSKLCTNKKEIANEFNNYFATICANNEIH